MLKPFLLSHSALQFPHLAASFSLLVPTVPAAKHFQEPDYLCYFRSSAGVVSDLSALCGQQHVPSPPAYSGPTLQHAGSFSSEGSSDSTDGEGVNSTP